MKKSYFKVFFYSFAEIVSLSLVLFTYLYILYAAALRVLLNKTLHQMPT